MTEAQLEYATEITGEMIDEAHAEQGMELRLEPWHNEATLDTIRHYAWGIGDYNPLFWNEEYAVGSKLGGMVAPPTFLYSVFDGAIGRGFVGVQPIYAGTKWTFHRWVRRGDRIVPRAVLGDVKILSGQHASRMVIQEVNTEYRLADTGELVGEAVGRTFRVPRAGAKGGLSYQPREQHQYSSEELERIREEAISEPRRGAERRYWEDVQPGEEIPAVVKGPIDQIAMTAYYAGCIGTPGYKSAEIAWLYRTWAVRAPERLPNNYDPTYYSEVVLPSLGHQHHGVARQIGMPGAYNNGPQKCGWMAHSVTNWMGDAGFLTSLEVRLRRPDIFGDTVWCSGVVESTAEDGLVHLTLRAVNQLGEQTAEGTASVRLPLRSARQ
jgi:acyl dehydratase